MVVEVILVDLILRLPLLCVKSWRVRGWLWLLGSERAQSAREDAAVHLCTVLAAFKQSSRPTTLLAAHPSRSGTSAGILQE